MKKIFLSIIIPIIFMFGCSSEKIVYVDANGTTINQHIKLERFTQKVVCNEYGVAYYETVTAYERSVYTPVFRDSKSIDEYPSIVTCEECEQGKFK